MRGARLLLFFPLEIGEDQKKKVYIRGCRVFTAKIGEDQKKEVVVVRDEVPHFLRGPRLQPA